MCGCVCVCGDSSILSANAHQFGAEDAINSAQDFYRGRRPCSSIERKDFGQLHLEVTLRYRSKFH